MNLGGWLLAGAAVAFVVCVAMILVDLIRDLWH